MSYNRDRAADFVLALMYLDVHEQDRAWKSYPWDVLAVLYDRGLISNPVGKAKSVALTSEGLDRAERAFNALLAGDAIAARRASRVRPASDRTRLSDLQQAQIERLLAPICKPDPDPKVNSQLRIGYRVDGYSVILFESRPAFQTPHEWREEEVARFRYVKSREQWQLFCMFRDLKWHAYEPLAAASDLAVLVAEVRKDPTGIFWG